MKGTRAWKGRPVIKQVRYLADAGVDPVQELGRQVVLATKTPTRAALLEAAAPLVKGFGVQHGKHIVARLKP